MTSYVKSLVPTPAVLVMSVFFSQDALHSAESLQGLVQRCIKLAFLWEVPLPRGSVGMLWASCQSNRWAASAGTGTSMSRLAPASAPAWGTCMPGLLPLSTGSRQRRHMQVAGVAGLRRAHRGWELSGGLQGRSRGLASG